MISKAERFWITMTLRAAFGFLFLIAAINIFSAGGPHDFGPDLFARKISAPFEKSWMGDLLPMVDNPFQGIWKKASAQEEAGKPSTDKAASDKSAADKAAADKAASTKKETAKANPSRADSGEKGKDAAEPGKAKKKPAKAKAAAPDMVHPTYCFLFLLPFIFAMLSVPILTGILLRPALRSGALLMVALGLGKYVADGQDLSTTANDFFFAFLICIGLYFLSQEKREKEGA